MLSINTLMRASAERKARLDKQARDKFLFNEYPKFADIKDFADYFKITVNEAILSITKGRVLVDMGL